MRDFFALWQFSPAGLLHSQRIYDTIVFIMD